MSNSHKTLHFLMVDDDEDFIQYLLSISSSYNIVVETSPNVQKALDIIKKKLFDAYIIDLQLPDGSGFDVIKKIREQGNEPVAAISGVFHDEESFRRLKEQYGVDYVLGKPVYQNQVEHLFATLSQKKPEKSEGTPQSKKKELKEYYKKTIPDKIDLISKLITGVLHHTDKTSLSDLQNALHKIAGSAGTYGYKSVTNLCRQLEYDLKEKLESGEEISKEWLSSLNYFLDELKYSFQFPDEEDSFELNAPSKKSTSFRNTLFVLDTDEKFLNLLEREKDRVDFPLTTESNPQKGKEILLSPDFHPRAVVVSRSFPGYEFNGCDLISKMQEKKDQLPTVYGIISDIDDIDLRVHLTKKGVRHFFVKPISPVVILDTINQEMPQARVAGFRVLVLDDDNDICKFIKEALSEVGIEVKAICDPKKLFKSLEEFRPHVLLLDVLLPKYDGLNLLKTLRADPSYRELAVVIITHYLDKIVNEVAYAEHAVDVMYKPLDKKLLQQNVLELERQQAASGRFIPLQSRTGLEPLSALNSRLKQILDKRDDEDKCLILFEMENYENFVLEVGRARANEFLISMGNLLIGVENDRMNSYFFEPTTFAILIERRSLKRVEEDLREILLMARSELELESALCAGIVPLSRRFTEPKMLLVVAKQALEEAKRTDSTSPVKIFLWQEEGRADEIKDVLIIDPDEDLQKMLKHALKQHNVNVNTFSSGGEAWDHIIKYQEASLPGLIVSERNLADMDGLALLDKVKHRFRHRIPFFFLTVYSSDHDIEEGIRQGASDYITKPFNLAILIHKIVVALYFGDYSKSMTIENE